MVSNYSYSLAVITHRSEIHTIEAKEKLALMKVGLMTTANVI